MLKIYLNSFKVEEKPNPRFQFDVFFDKKPSETGRSDNGSPTAQVWLSDPMCLGVAIGELGLGAW